jgi:hypothetical protein
MTLAINYIEDESFEVRHYSDYAGNGRYLFSLKHIF